MYDNDNEDKLGNVNKDGDKYKDMDRNSCNMNMNINSNSMCATPSISPIQNNTQYDNK